MRQRGATDSIEATAFADASVSQSGEVAHSVIAGRYEILGLLGVGGMGRVYRALDRELGETVALKVLHRSLVGEGEMIERFRQEVRLARRVTHRNVARTFDIGEQDGEKFLTMELVAGEPLSACIERGAMSLDRVVAIARDILAGVGAAHAVGVVHRDLKPDNVLIEHGGRVVVTDFGIARAELPGGASNTIGRTVGTPAYMAPEQVGGTVAIDGRADIYAFGLIVYEMITGVRAWPGTSALAVAAARLVEPPPDPRTHSKDVSPSLAQLVLRCTAREREERFGSVADVERALAAVDVSSAAPIAAPREAPIAPTRERSVAILPFRNLGPTDDAYFVEGLTEDLVDALSTVRGLRVRGRGYVDAADRDVVETGRRLGVDVVVEGSVRRAGGSMRVSPRVIGVADGFQLWSARFERPTGEAFALNDEVARAIADALSVRRSEAPRAQPSDPVAVDLYFRAKAAIGRFWIDGTDEAGALFDQALARAPDDPTILAGRISAQIGRNFFMPLDRVKTAALLRRALTAGEHLAEPWVALAAVRFNHHDDPAGAMRALKRALALGPSCAEAHDLAGRILLEVDEMNDAVAHLERALWLDERQRWARIDLMRAAALRGDWSTAQELYMGGTLPDWTAHRRIHEARLWSWPGAPELDVTPLPDRYEPRFRTMFEAFYRARRARAGIEPFSLIEIRATMDPMMAVASPARRARRFFHQMMAELALLAGHHDGALELLGLAVSEGLLDLAWMNRVPLLDPLRGRPELESLRQIVLERALRVVEAWRGPPESLAGALASIE